ncbi:MAG: recombinase family protein, partial [Rickettsia endosymbiont of Gnoriste bilineata]|nr:recombinase family protein [Rickettsia endosymbiont of Gnoriste bilineata]
MIKCAATGRVVTAETKKKTYVNGKTTEWTYLRVWQHGNTNKRIYVQEKQVLGEVEKVLAM